MWQGSFNLIDWSFWRGCCCLWLYPPKSIVVSWKQEALELGCVFYSSTQIELSNKNCPIEGFSATFRISVGNLKKALKPKRKEMKGEEFKYTWRILHYIQNCRRQEEQEDKRKKPKKMGFYSSSQKEEKRKKEAENVGCFYMNLYFRRIVFLRKRINDFS